MPGVLIDEQFQLDAMPPSSLYDSFTPQLSHAEAQQLMRRNSFSGVNDGSPGLSHSAPVYHRSQSAISSAAALQAFNYFNSPPTTPKKSSDPGSYSPMSMLDVVGNEYSENEGMGGLGATSASAVAMAISGNSVPGDFRSLAFGNSAIVGSPTLGDSVSAYKFLPSNNEDEESWTTVNDVYACDQFRMFEFKVRRCMRGRSHDWTECPFAHPGEKARRRDPRRFHYSGTACPDFRKGSCRRGDACEFAHGVFECWLHPARYRTQPCKDGRNCRRRVCFFAHTPEQLRLLPAAAQAASAAARTGGLNGNQSAFSATGSLPGSYAASPGRSGVSFDGAFSQCSHGGACGHFDPAFGGGAHTGHCCASPQMSSPTSTLVGHSSSPPPLSPPLSPRVSPPMSPQSPNWSSAALRPDSRPFPQTGKASHGLSQAAFNSASFQVPHGHGSYAQGPCSPLSRGSNSSTAMAPHAHNAQSITPSQRRHMDRLNSMPALAIPQVDHTHRVNGMLQAASSPLSSPSSCSPPSPGGVSSGSPSISELVAGIHQLGLKSNGPVPLWLQAQTVAAANQYSSGPSPLRRCSQSVPCTPTKLSYENRSGRWEVEAHEEVEPPVQRVESGRDLRAKIYGKLGKESRADGGGEAPDLDWVNELVKDEQVW